MNVARRFGTIIAVGLLLTIVSTATAKYSGGTGEPNDPYQIATAADLIALGGSPADYDRCFILTADIDMDPNLPSRRVFDKAVIAPVTVSCGRGGPCVPTSPPFSGVFNGNRHTIAHLTISGLDYVGLFGRLERGSEVKDLGVVDINMTGSDTVGGVVSINGTGSQEGGSVTCCYTTGLVNGTYDVGGMVGMNRGYVTQCYNFAMVCASESYVGGLVGMNAGVVIQSHSTGTVRGNSHVGGLVGSNGMIMENGWSGDVINCYSTGDVEGNEYVGGLVGVNDAGSVVDCYSTGTVSSDGCVGGLVGYNGQGDVTRCYSAGAVSGTGEHVGGLVGYAEGWRGALGPVNYFAACFWDTQTSGQSTSDAGTGKTTGEMQMASTFPAWGCTPAVWTIDEGVDYPRLAWENKPGKALPVLADFVAGSGSQGDPYLISTPEELNMVGLFRCDWGKHFKLMADIDMSGLHGNDGRIAFNIIGENQASAFAGIFDGNGHTISHVAIEGQYCVGVFGYLTSGAEIRDLGVVDVNIIASGAGVGGLVGCNCGNVTNCYSTGSVGGVNLVGGLVGSNEDGEVTKSHSTNTVSGQNSVGGLVGENLYGTVTQCYSTGAVRGGGLFVGGLVGLNHGSSANCFWDIQTSGQATSAAGTGLTTAEMQTAKTFLDAGWDFVYEIKNGTEDTWFMPENGYPKLVWQTTDAMTILTVPTYRFRSPATSHYFYTTSESEKQKLIDKYSDAWTYEGLAFRVLPDGVEPNSLPVYRFWSSVLGGRFYTIKDSEKDELISKSWETWAFEGIAFYAYPEGGQPAGTSPVYRFWSDKFGCYFYTISEAERDECTNDPSHVWTYEGVAWYAYK